MCVRVGVHSHSKGVTHVVCMLQNYSLSWVVSLLVLVHHVAHLTHPATGHTIHSYLRMYYQV